MPSRFMTKIFITLLLAIAATLTVTAHTLRGTLVNYKGKPITKAKIYTRDRKKSVKPNYKGEFLLKDVEPEDTLHIEYFGEVHDLPIDGVAGMFIKINKKPVKGAKDGVNMGAGTIRASDYNGPRSVMNAQRLQETATQDLLQAMTAMPGVTYAHGDSQKGISDNISIRNSQFKPLWILDGIQMTDPPDITVMEIESIEVLADGAMYGTRAAGGVVIITTKATAFKVP